MANITITKLHSSGSELLIDGESYLREISEGELDISGGLSLVNYQALLNNGVNAGRRLVNEAYQAGRDLGNGIGRAIYEVTHE